MSSPNHDPIVATARIVTPEEVARDKEELLGMKAILAVTRMGGVPMHLVKFSDGPVALVPGDSNDKDAWNAALKKVHAAAVAGQLGPVDVTSKRGDA